MEPHQTKPVPDWMKQKEDYTPCNDRDGFASKTLLKMMSMLARCKNNNPVILSSVSPFVKIDFTFGTILLLALSRNAFFSWCILAQTLVFLCFLPGKTLKTVIGTSVVSTICSILILLPAVFFGATHTMLTIACKVFISTAMIQLLAISTPWNQLTESLRFFCIPDIFIFTLDITLKYIVILGENCGNMLEALKLRSVGKNRKKSQAFSGILGVTFLKAKEMAGETYEAMQCRGFEGEYRRVKKPAFQKKDIYAAILFLCILVLYLRLEYYL